jgi:hypothetical protein
MKTVFPSHELPHLWAHQKAPMGRSGNLSFNGLVFFSYQTAIARIIQHKGRQAYLINTTSFSVSTAKHQSMIRGAIPQNAVKFYIERGRGTWLDVSPKELFQHCIAESAQCLADAKRPRIRQATIDAHKGRAAHWLQEAARVSEFFGLRLKPSEKTIARLASAKAKEEKRQAVAKAEAEARAEAEAQAAIAKWIAGESDRAPWQLTGVRLRIKGGNLETSKGVTIPEREAHAAFLFIARHRADGWHRNGENFLIGGYHLDAINDQGIVAGCHRIAWAEIDRISALAGWAV